MLEKKQGGGMQHHLTFLPGGGFNVILDGVSIQMVFDSGVLHAQESCRWSEFLSNIT